jgi:hypothetical protein
MSETRETLEALLATARAQREAAREASNLDAMLRAQLRINSLVLQLRMLETAPQ